MEIRHTATGDQLAAVRQLLKRKHETDPTDDQVRAEIAVAFDRVLNDKVREINEWATEQALKRPTVLSKIAEARQLAVDEDVAERLAQRVKEVDVKEEEPPAPAPVEEPSVSPAPPAPRTTARK
jgi:hypothetical protein